MRILLPKLFICYARTLGLEVKSWYLLLSNTLERDNRDTKTKPYSTVPKVIYLRWYSVVRIYCKFAIAEKSFNCFAYKPWKFQMHSLQKFFWACECQFFPSGSPYLCQGEFATKILKEGTSCLKWHTPLVTQLNQ